MISRLTAATFLFSSLLIGVALADKLPVSIYFESLCTDSIAFLKYNGTFEEGYKALKDNLKLDFVPYGHANKTDCQHGPLECEGNKIIGCALEKMTNDTDQVAFVQCIMSLNVQKNGTTTFPAEQCKNSTTSDAIFAEIISCSKSNEGNTLFEKNGNTTNAFFGNTKFNVPYVAINNTRNDTTSNELTKNFKSVLCDNLKDHKLSACGNSASTLVASIFPAILALLIARL